MTNSQTAIASLESSELLARTRELVAASSRVEADLLLHLAEVDERKLYRDLAFPSMFAYCVDELGFSEDAAYNRIFVARAARRFPAVIESIRSARVHLYGARLLVPHLTDENCAEVLGEAAGKSKRDIELIVARFAPRPSVPTIVRQLSGTPVPTLPLTRSATPVAEHRMTPLPLLPVAPGPVAPASFAGSYVSSAPLRHDSRGSVVAPLSATTYKIQFTASDAFHEKLRQAQALLRHRVRDGDVATILESALDTLIHNVQKERFAVGRKPRSTPDKEDADRASRHIPDAIKRAVFERDGGRCTFLDDRGRRCEETGSVQFDHMDGFARHGVHDVNRIRLLCRSHNQHAAEKMYGIRFMSRARSAHTSTSACSGTTSNDPAATGPPASAGANGTD